jgi:hypothetical protein
LGAADLEIGTELAETNEDAEMEKAMFPVLNSIEDFRIAHPQSQQRGDLFCSALPEGIALRTGDPAVVYARVKRRPDKLSESGD